MLRSMLRSLAVLSTVRWRPWSFMSCKSSSLPWSAVERLRPFFV
jgi:hypothetical protein